MTRLIIASDCLFAISSGTSSAAGEAIAYRLPKWNTMHFEDSAKAKQHLAAVKKLGCEAKADSHSGHIDVAYRSGQWRSLEVATDKLAHQWEAWLKGAGFETLHGHAENHAGHDHDGHGHAGHDHADHDHAGHNHGPNGAEEVAYRLPRWKTVHIKDKAQMEEFVALMKGFGCEVRTEAHSGHVDTSVRCPEWKHIELPTHKVAQRWESWLAKNGFEVRHEH